jgi:hypothetical protein
LKSLRDLGFRSQESGVRSFEVAQPALHDLTVALHRLTTGA